MSTSMIDIEQENKLILNSYRSLLRAAKGVLKEGDSKLIKKAFKRAAEAHDGVRRKSGEPYILHPLEVARITVSEIGLGTTSIVAALLHDVVEDTPITVEDIKDEFGETISDIIDGLTKISDFSEKEGQSAQAENFRKMLLTLSTDVRVILIKLADRLHNMRTLESMPSNKKLKIASETSFIYAPLAHRLGLYAIKSEFEDLHLKFTQREVYNDIKSKINATREARRKFIGKFIQPIKKSLSKAKFSFQVKGRPKSIYSIWKKMQSKNVSFEEVYDLFAIRIIINETEAEKEKAACWSVYSIVTDFYSPNPERLRDWISTPRANGYESLHTTVMSHSGQWVEVQIRTNRMDEIAEKGFAAHWRYKENHSKKTSSLEVWLNQVRDLLENNEGNAIEFVNEFRNNFFQKEIFVYTPKGELKRLPGGATALDFAFEIHTEIGGRCVGTKVNSRLVPMSTPLNSGDQVEVLTNPNQKPKASWMKIVVTSKARAAIRDAMKEEYKAQTSEGKEIVKRKLKQMKLSLNDKILNELRAYFDMTSISEFYFQVGSGQIDSTKIKQFKDLKEVINYKQRKFIDAKNFEREIAKIHKDQGIHKEQVDQLLIGEDMDVVDYVLAKCCNPIPGDEVFGFVTVSEGIKIHRTKCPNSVELMSNYGYRVVKARWTSQKEIAFLAGLAVSGTDRVGLINDVTAVISKDLKVNMRAMTIETVNGVFEGKIQVFVNDTNHLENLISSMMDVQGIVTVNRFDALAK